jgi:hypothetical protein
VSSSQQAGLTCAAYCRSFWNDSHSPDCRAESGGWGYGGGEEWNDGDGEAGEDVALALADLWVGEG